MSVIVEQQGAVLIVTLNKPAGHNALDGETMSGVGAALADAESDDSVAVVVLTGVGDRSSCAGMDLKAFAAGGITPCAADGPGLGVLIGGTYSKLLSRLPTVARAGGLELVLACDLIVAAEHAKFGIPDVKRWLVAAGGSIPILPQRIPLSIALKFGPTQELIDTHRDRQLGLVDTVLPAGSVLAEATWLAELIAVNRHWQCALERIRCMPLPGAWTTPRAAASRSRSRPSFSVELRWREHTLHTKAGTRLDGTVKCRSARWTDDVHAAQSGCARVEAMCSGVWIGRSARTATSDHAAGGCKHG